MTLFQCEKCKKTFIHPAKLTRTITTIKIKVDIPDDSTSNIQMNPKASTNIDALETSVCPFCQSTAYTEAPEPTPDNLEDILQVPFEQVKEYLGKGYVELNRTSAVFSKGIIMLKTQEKKSE
jgi:hypothetical protein